MGAMSNLHADQEDERQQQDQPEPTMTESTKDLLNENFKIAMDFLERADALRSLIEKHSKELQSMNYKIAKKYKATELVDDSDIPF